jgi:hypothetical protein
MKEANNPYTARPPGAQWMLKLLRAILEQDVYGIDSIFGK